MIRRDLVPVTEEFLSSLPGEVLEGMEVYLCFAGGWRASPYRLKSQNGKIMAFNISAGRWLQLDHIGPTKQDTRLYLENPDTNIPLTFTDLLSVRLGTLLWVKYAGWSKSVPCVLVNINQGIAKFKMQRSADFIDVTQIGDKRGDIQIFREEYQWR